MRTTAAATRAFANEVDAALCEFVTKTVAGLKAAGVSTANLVNGTLADTAIRETISGSVRAIKPVLPLTRLTVRQVAAGVLAIEDATVAAMGRMVRATVNLAKAVVTVSSTTLAAMCTVADSAVTAMHTVLVAVRTTLNNLTDVNITAAVDASLTASAG